jgi:hypothetical protein
MHAATICSIPLCTRQVDDFWAWHYENKGVFSVRSAYNMLVQRKYDREAWLDGTAGSSDSETDQKTWTKWWSVQVPSKVKFFVWRLAQQSIPSAGM